MKRAFAEYLISAGILERRRIEALDIDWETRERVGGLALMHNLLLPGQLDQVLERQLTARHLFGKTAVGMKLLRDEQLRILLHGQAVRSCLELIEALAIERELPILDGLRAVAQFLPTQQFIDALQPVLCSG